MVSYRPLRFVHFYFLLNFPREFLLTIEDVKKNLVNYFLSSMMRKSSVTGLSAMSEDSRRRKGLTRARKKTSRRSIVIVISIMYYIVLSCNYTIHYVNSSTLRVSRLFLFYCQSSLVPLSFPFVFTRKLIIQWLYRCRAVVSITTSMKTMNASKIGKVQVSNNRTRFNCLTISPQI